ncbi:MAG: LamG domain-containing protein, partial [archaeon]|nr:LamG domain-containing protein [archaeon]
MMVDKKYLIFGLFVVLLGIVGATLTTQSDSNSVALLTAYINISAEGYPTINQLNWTWANAVNRLYDNDLLLMLNFENLSVLGDNATYIKDMSKYGNDFVEVKNGVNSTWTSAGRYGGGWDFSGKIGTSGYLSNQTEIILNENSTISLWVYPDNRNSGGIFYGGSQFDFYGFYNTINAPMRYGFQLNASIGVNCLPSYDTLKNWTHIVLLKESGGVKFYLNGDLCANQSVSLNGRIDHIKLIGGSNYASSNSFNGTLDEIMVWNRSLTEDEISQLYHISLQKVDTDKWYFQANETLVAGDNAWNFTISNDTAIESVSGTEAIGIYYNITDCTNLTGVSGGIYTLLNNITSNGTCLTIVTNNITIDGNGYEINYSKNGTVGYGIYARANYTAIKNLRIKEGSATTSNKHGIYFSGANNGLVSNNTILTTGSTTYGIYLLTSSNSNTLDSNIV